MQTLYGCAKHRYTIVYGMDWIGTEWKWNGLDKTIRRTYQRQRQRDETTMMNGRMVK